MSCAYRLLSHDISLLCFLLKVLPFIFRFRINFYLSLFFKMRFRLRLIFLCSVEVQLFQSYHLSKMSFSMNSSPKSHRIALALLSKISCGYMCGSLSVLSCSIDTGSIPSRTISYRVLLNIVHSVIPSTLLLFFSIVCYSCSFNFPHKFQGQLAYIY